MPVINITLSDDDYKQLQDGYKRMAVAWPSPERSTLPPSFDAWCVTRVATGNHVSARDASLEELRAFNAIESLITTLRPHGFGLAYLGKQGGAPSDSAVELAESIVRNLNLSQQQSKRIQELVEYYSTSAKEIADLAQVGVTNRTYGALHEAYRELVDRTNTALERLGEERAIGRVEGAVAILVNLHVMDRHEAKEKTEAFKTHARNPKKRVG